MPQGYILKNKFHSTFFKLFTLADRLRFTVKCYLYDFNIARRNLNWQRTGLAYWKLSAELIFQFHKIEKGLCLPGPKRFFGADAATATMNLMGEWVSSGLPVDHPIYVASMETLRAYQARLQITPPDATRASLVARLDALLATAQPRAELATPIALPPISDAAYEQLLGLAHARRSVRHFSDRPVDFALVEKALEIAQLSPSACNRQPWRIHFFEKREQIESVLHLQNGNNGFRHEIPLVAIIAADMNCFFDSSERIEPILDSGLFLMSFLLALQSLGLSSCCLNWCVTPKADKRLHVIADIPENHQISTFLAIGYAADDTIVPLSARRPVSDVAVRH